MYRMMMLVAAGLGLVGCGPLTLVVGAGPGQKRLAASVVESDGRLLSDRVAIIDVSGLIYNANKPGLLQKGENPVSFLYEKLEKARRDGRVKAVILRLNTPGGTVTASDAMYRQVVRFGRQSGKPVVALMMDVAASGGYYLACAADHVVAYPTTVTGSIGVIVQTISIKPALNQLGVETHSITSGKNKDAGSLLSTLTLEKRAVLEALVNDFYGRFVEVVRRSRPEIPDDRLAHLTDGRIMSGDQALAAGLIDQVGDLYNAFSAAKQRAGIRNADLVLYHRPLDYVASPYAKTGANTNGGTQINLAQFNISSDFGGASAGFFYLWPGVQ